MDFQTCKSDVGKWVLDLPATTASMLGTWVNEAVREGERGHNFRHMERSYALTTTAATRVLGSKPDDWKEVREDPWLQGNDGAVSEIDWGSSSSDMRRQFSQATTLDIGVPQFVLETPDGFEGYPYSDGRSDWPGGQYRVNVPYWAYSPDMEEDADTTKLLELCPFYVVFRAAAFGFIFNQDEDRGAQFLALAKSHLDTAVRLDKRSKLPSRINLTPRRGVYGFGLPPRPAHRRR